MKDLVQCTTESFRQVCRCDGGNRERGGVGAGVETRSVHTHIHAGPVLSAHSTAIDANLQSKRLSPENPGGTSIAQGSAMV